MERAFITRGPKPAELTLLSKFLASFRDGTGLNREHDGSSRADSRQIERCFAELLHGRTTENKAFYDFVVESNESGGIAVRGASIKSKEISKLLDYNNITKRDSMRAYLELSNSSAKDWARCKENGLSETDFTNHKHADKFGAVLLARQEQERVTAEKSYVKAEPGKSKFFVLEDSVYISVLYSPQKGHERNWLVSSFAVKLPAPTEWLFRKKHLAGLDANGATLYEWYGLSGSQFKYYPLLSSRLHGTDLFEVPNPTQETLRAKVSRLFGD